MAGCSCTAKILIWKQFTTSFEDFNGSGKLFVHCKDTNLKAIHNWKADKQRYVKRCSCTAKILIWKQFTTPTPTKAEKIQLFVHCKDTNLKAIHNNSLPTLSLLLGCSCTAKILIWKQFTTGNYNQATSSELFVHCKDTNLKAIHNKNRLFRCIWKVVRALQRY